MAPRPGDNEEEDCWDAFGGDDDEEEEEEEGDDQGGDRDDDGEGAVPTNNGNVFDSRAAFAMSLHLSQVFLKHNSQVPLSTRKVLVVYPSVDGDGNHHHHERHSVSKALKQREMTVIASINSTESQQQQQQPTDVVDAMIVLDDSVNLVESWAHQVAKYLCHGGTLILPETLMEKELEKLLLPDEATSSTGAIICKIHNNKRSIIDDNELGSSISFVARTKKSARAHASTCLWLPSSYSVAAEEERLQQATVTLSTHESSTSRMTDVSVRRAVHHMNHYGYCIIRSLLEAEECEAWGRAVLDSVHAAAKILVERDGVDIYNPQSSQFEPQSYRELSMREDLRLDIRQGPALTKIRADCGDGTNGSQSIVLTAADRDYGGGIFLRGHPSLLEIVRLTMNPKDARNSLYRGNMGRYNFGGSGADGSYQDLRLSPVGGIVSLPGAADQALHADTPHLFEHIPDLPAHYVNIFAPAVPFDEHVGGTAFVHGSHDLAFTAEFCGGENDDNSKVYPFLVRPSLTVGDVVLFDCRILHFGLANTSASVERCICYTNTWHNWFHDKKNWDLNRKIFE